MVHPANLGDFDKMEALFRGLGIKDWTVDVPYIKKRRSEIFAPYSLPERIIEIISQIPSKKAAPNADRPRMESPYIFGPIPVACRMAELRRIELTIMLNEIWNQQRQRH